MLKNPAELKYFKEKEMKMYNFDEENNRRNSNSTKWNCKLNELPMWIADVDFKTCPDVIKAIKKRIQIGSFGYSDIPDEYFLEYKKWFKKYHNVNYEIEDMVYSSGVVASISSMVRKLTTPGEKVLVLSPVYNIFYNSIINNGRFVVTSNLIYNGFEYFIDFEDLENKMKDPQVSLMILCNPHNPVGKIFTKDELEKIAKCAKKHNVLIISDEIHCENITNGVKYTPFLSVSDDAREIGIACHSLSKAFNLAGLQSACVVSKNKLLRYKIWRGINTDEVGEPNFFACEATIAALKKGKKWLVELNNYIYENKKYFTEKVNNELDLIHVQLTDATYMLWIDCTKLKIDSNTLVKNLREKTGLILSSGSVFGENGDGFLRINLATAKKNVIDATNRFINFFKNF